MVKIYKTVDDCEFNIWLGKEFVDIEDYAKLRELCDDLSHSLEYDELYGDRLRVLAKYEQFKEQE